MSSPLSRRATAAVRTTLTMPRGAIRRTTRFTHYRLDCCRLARQRRTSHRDTVSPGTSRGRPGRSRVALGVQHLTRVHTPLPYCNHWVFWLRRRLRQANTLQFQTPGNGACSYSLVANHTAERRGMSRTTPVVMTGCAVGIHVGTLGCLRSGGSLLATASSQDTRQGSPMNPMCASSQKAKAAQAERSEESGARGA